MADKQQGSMKGVASKANQRQHRKHAPKYRAYREGMGQARCDARKIRNLEKHNRMTAKEAKAFWVGQTGRAPGTSKTYAGRSV